MTIVSGANWRSPREAAEPPRSCIPRDPRAALPGPARPRSRSSPKYGLGHPRPHRPSRCTWPGSDHDHRQGAQRRRQVGAAAGAGTAAPSAPGVCPGLSARPGVPQAACARPCAPALVCTDARALGLRVHGMRPGLNVCARSGVRPGPSVRGMGPGLSVPSCACACTAVRPSLSALLGVRPGLSVLSRAPQRLRLFTSARAVHQAGGNVGMRRW